MRFGRVESGRRLIGLGLIGVFGTVLFVSLGIWQLERRTWKLELIARVDDRVHAAPVAPPPAASWPTTNARADEYRHVRVGGRFRNDRTVLVQAVTQFGRGYWVMTPLRMESGDTVLINRGFVPESQHDTWVRHPSGPTGGVTITGLLRMTEPKGGFLHSNEPRRNRWYSRDVNAIAAAESLDHVAPYFIDADRQAESGPNAPVGGLTVVRFPNNHLQYAITWFTLAVMLAGGLGHAILGDAIRGSFPWTTWARRKAGGRTPRTI